MDCGPPGSSVQGILQARKLEWVAEVLLPAVGPRVLVSELGFVGVLPGECVHSGTPRVAPGTTNPQDCVWGLPSYHLQDCDLRTQLDQIRGHWVAETHSPFPGPETDQTE